MRTFLILFCVLSSIISFGQENKLSPGSQVYLLTISPGVELYSSFGHSTILIEDYENRLSEMYNYGSFDFETENFYLKFLRGTLPYQLTKNDLQRSLTYWTFQNRLVTKQKLRMTLEQRQQMYDLLEKNYQPENRTYQYKFFYDNCSTRIRDLIVQVMGNDIKFNKDLNASQSYRDWIDNYAGHKALADFGMDIAIGIPADQRTGYDGAMYIPDNLMYAFDSAAVVSNGSANSFVVDKEVINSLYTSGVSMQKEIDIPLILAVLLLLGSLYLVFNKSYRNKSRVGIGNKVIFFSAGIAGVILMLLWLLTDHGVTAYNLNVLWANPLFLYMFIRQNRTKKIVFLCAAIAAASILLIDLIQIQDIPLTADVISIAFALRLYTIYAFTYGKS